MNSNVCCMCMCMYIQDYIRQSIKNIQLLRKFRKNLQSQKNDQDSKLRNSNICNEKETNKPLRYFQEITIKYICTYRCILIYIIFLNFSKIYSNASNPEGEMNSASDRRRSAGSDYVSGSQASVSATNELVKRVESFQRHKYLCGLSKFFHNLMHKARLPTDVYALMFLCDFINFFVLLFGFTAFSVSNKF